MDKYQEGSVLPKESRPGRTYQGNKKLRKKKTDNNLLISQRERTTGPYNKETKEYGSLGRSIAIPHQTSRYKNMVQGGNANQGILDI